MNTGPVMALTTDILGAYSRWASLRQLRFRLFQRQQPERESKSRRYIPVGCQRKCLRGYPHPVGGVDYNVTPNDRWTFRGSVSANHTHETDGTDIVQENYLWGGNTYSLPFSTGWTTGVSALRPTTPLNISGPVTTACS